MPDPSTAQDAIQNKWILGGVLAAFSGLGVVFTTLMGLVSWLVGDKVKTVREENTELFRRVNTLETNAVRVETALTSEIAHNRETLKRIEDTLDTVAGRFDALYGAMCISTPKRKEPKE